MRGGEREGGRDDGTIGTIITDYTASPVQRRSCHLVISEGQSSVFTIPSPASWACDADSCDNVGVFGGKMTPLSFVSTADYVPTLPLLMILYWCVTKVWNICWPTPQIRWYPTCPDLVCDKQCHMPVFTLAINLYWLMCTQVQIRAQGRALLRSAAATQLTPPGRRGCQLLEIFCSVILFLCCITLCRRHYYRYIVRIMMTPCTVSRCLVRNIL